MHKDLLELTGHVEHLLTVRVSACHRLAGEKHGDALSGDFQKFAIRDVHANALSSVCGNSTMADGLALSRRGPGSALRANLAMCDVFEALPTDRDGLRLDLRRSNLPVNPLGRACHDRAATA